MSSEKKSAYLGEFGQTLRVEWRSADGILKIFHVPPPPIEGEKKKRPRIVVINSPAFSLEDLKSFANDIRDFVNSVDEYEFEFTEDEEE